MDRRHFLKTAGITLASVGRLSGGGDQNAPQATTIRDVQIASGVTIESDDGTLGKFAGSGAQDLETLAKHLPTIRELLTGKNPFDSTLSGELLWEAIYPGKAKRFAEGRDPLTGEVIANRPRNGRHTPKGRVFMAFSTVDIVGELCSVPERNHPVVYINIFSRAASQMARTAGCFNRRSTEIA